MAKQIRITMMLIVVFMLLPHSANTTVPTQGQAMEIVLPIRVELENFLVADTGNDIFFTSNVDNGVLPHEYRSRESTYNLFAYDGTDIFGPTGYNPIVQSFMATNPDVLYHASNTSSLGLDLEYTAVFYDLTRGETDLDGLDNVILFEDEMSGFRFEASGNLPMILDLTVKGEFNSVKLDIFIVSPSGVVYDYSLISVDFQSFVNQFIPIVPTESGTHTLYISPTSEDVTLERMKLYDSIDVNEIGDGVTHDWKGTETQTIFFKFKENITEELKMLELASTVFYNDTVGSPDVLLGRLSLSYFTPTTNIFGAEMPAINPVIQWKNNATYVAVTATPPNDADPFVSGIKNELGLDPGFDIEYTFWGREFLIEDEFEIGVNTDIEDADQPNSNKYLWKTTQELYLGINSTLASSAIITDLDNQDTIYNLDSTQNDVLHVESHVPILLPAGNYMVELKDAFAANEVRIYTITIVPLQVGQTTNVFINLNDPLFYRLTVNSPMKESIDFTYKGFGVVNSSVDVNVRLYDSSFAQQSSTSKIFDEYYDNSGTTRFSDNNTVVGNTNVNAQYNIVQGYMRVSSDWNQLWNDDGSINDTTVPDFQANFDIVRQNYLQNWDDSDPDIEYEPRIFDQAVGDLETINGSKSNIVFVYDFNTATTPTGYLMTFSAVNSSYQIYTFVDWNSQWHNINVNSPVTIDGEPNYNYNLEFGTNMEVNFGIIVLFTPTLNGTFSVGISPNFPKETSGVSLNSINTVKYVPPEGAEFVSAGDGSDDESFFDENGVLLGVGALVVVGGAGVFVIIRRRGGSL